MSSDKRVVVYGASGYTGKLIAEHLRELNVPFIAAGRNEERVKDCELFTGAEVVCNTVGPFATHGHEVAQAALNAGCHYLDTTGEQNWVMDARDRYGEEYAAKGLLLAPSTSYMHQVSDIAANIALETAGIDSLEILCLFSGTPTFASTQSIFTILMADHYYLEENSYRQWAPASSYNVHVPGYHDTFLALPWGGSAHPVWWKDDPRVVNARALSGVFDQPLMHNVAGMAKKFEEEIKPLPPEQRQAALAEIASGVQGGTPPREQRSFHRTLDSVIGRGPNKMVRVDIHGNATYLQTGLIQAWCARRLLTGPPKAVGFAPATKAFGHRELLGALQGFGFLGEPVVTGHV
jgi:NAD(P)-dependent dehydrogenase (short-subunit alcohol dehydrogenase family)